MTWTGSNPVTIGNPTKKSDYDALWDNADYLHDKMCLVSAYANLAAAITAIGATEQILVIDEGVSLSDDNTFPATLSVIVRKGCVITIANTKTLTINGDFQAGLYQVFAGDGAASFGTGSVRCVYPQWWGADPDDTGTSDQAAVAAAIAAAPTGGTVFFPATSNYYKLTDAVTVSKALTLDGEGRESEIRQTTSNKGAIAVTASNVTIRNLYLYGPQYTTYQSSEDGIYAYGTDNNPAAPTYITGLRIQDCDIKNWGDAGIQCVYVSDFETAGNYIEDCHYHGIMHHSCKNGRVHHNEVRDIYCLTSNGNGYGISFSRDAAAGTDLTTDPRCEDILCDHNDIYNVDDWEGLDTHSGDNITFDSNNIIDCKYGIAIVSVQDGDGTERIAQYCSATNNKIITSVASPVYGINVGGNASGMVEHITVNGNYIEGHASGAVRVVHSNFTRITNNNIYNSGTAGIRLQDENYDFLVAGNLIDTIVNDANAVGGILIENKTQRGAILGNIIDATNADYGICNNISDEGQDILVRDNKITGFGTAKYKYYGRLLWGIIEDHSDASTDGVGEDNLKSQVVYADLLGSDGEIKVFAAGTKTGSESTKTIKLYFGSTSWTVHAAANNTNDWRLEATIANTATNAQRISWVCWDGATVAQGYETAAEDTTSGVTLKLTGTCDNGADSITQTMWRLERVYDKD